MEKLIIGGVDNYGNPKQLYVDNLALMNDEALFKETEQKIWLSAYASNNHRSDYHWQCDSCYNECKRRSKPEIYSQAYDKARRTM